MPHSLSCPLPEAHRGFKHTDQYSQGISQEYALSLPLANYPLFTPQLIESNIVRLNFLSSALADTGPPFGAHHTSKQENPIQFHPVSHTKTIIQLPLPSSQPPLNTEPLERNFHPIYMSEIVHIDSFSCDTYPSYAVCKPAQSITSFTGKVPHNTPPSHNSTISLHTSHTS